MTAALDLFGAAAPVQPAPGPAFAGSPAIIRAAVERERRALAGLGQFGPTAERQAVVIARAKLGNAPDLAERQAHDGRCHACGEPLDDRHPVVAVTTGRPRAALWLHSGACHDTHRHRHADRVDEWMTAAGFPCIAGEPCPRPAHHQEPRRP